MYDYASILKMDTIKTAVCWIAGCSVIGYAIKKSHSLMPLWALGLLPSFSTRFTTTDTPAAE